MTELKKFLPGNQMPNTLKNQVIKQTTINGKNFTKVWLNKIHTRFILVDEFGKKDKVVLRTKSSRYITRTIQFHEFYGTKELLRVKYKHKELFVNYNTILED